MKWITFLKNKKILFGMITALLVGSGSYAVVHSQKVNNMFDPSKFQESTDENTSDVNVDSNVFGTDQSDSSGMEMDKNAEEDYNVNDSNENQLKNDSTADNNVLSFGTPNNNDTNTSTGNGNVFGSDSNSNITISGNTGSGDDAGGNGIGTGSGNGSGGNNGSGNGQTGNNDKETYEGIENIGTPNNTENSNSNSSSDLNGYNSIEIICKNKLKYYIGQEVKIAEIRDELRKEENTVNITIVNGKTGEIERVAKTDAIDNIFFGDTDNNTFSEIADTNGKFSLVYKVNGYKSDGQNTTSLTYTCYKYRVKVSNYDKSTLEEMYTNDSSVNIQNYYNLALAQIEKERQARDVQDTDFINEDRYMTKLILGWYEGTSISDYSCASIDLEKNKSNNDVSLKPLVQDIEDSNLRIKIQKDSDGNYQQCLVGYDGTSENGTLTIPAGVTSVMPAVVQNEDKNTSITKIIFPGTVKTIDIQSLYQYFPNCKVYEIENNKAEDSPYMDMDGMLLSKDEDKLISVPANYDKEVIDLSKLSGTVFIDEDALTAYANKNLQIKVSETLLLTGWDNVPNKNRGKETQIIVPTSEEDTNLAYVRYCCQMKESNNSFSIIVWDGEEIVMPDYTIENGCVYLGYGTQNCTLVYVLPTSNKSYTTPDEAIIIGDTAFVDIENIEQLTINENTSKIEKDALNKLQKLTTVVVEKPENISALPDTLYKNSASDKLMIYLKGITESDIQYDLWCNALKNVYKTETETKNHIQCIEADADIWVDSSNNASYLVEGNKYTLQSLPVSATSYLVPDILQDSNKKLVAIAKGAFNDCTQIKCIILPETVTTVEDNTFAECSKLEVLYVSEQLRTKLDGQASKLIASNKTAIYDDNNKAVFYNTDKTKLLAVLSNYKGTLKLDSKTTVINDNAVRNCKLVENVEVTSGELTKIGKNAFKGCTSLENLPMDKKGEVIDDYQVIDDNAFEGCSELQSITIGGNNLELKNSVFKDCTKLANATWGVKEDNTIITTGESTFSGCNNMTESYFKCNVSKIGDATYEGASSLATLWFLNGSMEALESIGNKAFKNCEKLTYQQSFNQFPVLESVGDEAFYNCSQITNCNFGASVKTIGARAFAEEEPTNNMYFTVSFNENSKIETIGEAAFANNISIRTIYLNKIEADSSRTRSTEKFEGVEIGASAFEGCKSVNQILWGQNSLKSIGAKAFAGCESLSNAEIGYQYYLDEVGEAAFAGCKSLKVVSFADAARLNTLAKNLFGIYGDGAYCEVLETVRLGAGITSIEEGAFSGACALSTLELSPLSNNVVNINKDAFCSKDDEMVSNLAVVVPENLKDKYLNNEQWQAALTIKDTTYIDSAIATDAADATRTYNGGKYQSNGDGTYTLISMSTTITDGVALLTNTTKIADGAFEGCNKMTSIIIPENTSVVGKNVFHGCTALEAVVFQNSKEMSIDTSLFGDTSINENFRVYITSGTGGIYSKLKALKPFYSKIFCTGDSWTVTSEVGALYAAYYEPDSKYSLDDGYTYQLMYVPRSYAGKFTINNRVAHIYKEAMKGCTSLTYLLMGGSRIATIGESACEGCTKLTYLDLRGYDANGSLEYIGNYAFKDCESLYASVANAKGQYSTTFILNHFSYMGEGVFEGCKKIKYARWDSKNLSDVPDSTFKNCTSLQYLTTGTSLINNNKPLVSFGDSCFEGCTSFTTSAGSLASFVGLKSIGNNCYKGCTNMSLLTLPENLESIGENALEGCDKLTVLSMNSNKPIDLVGTGINDISKIRLYVPIPYEEAYRQALSSTGIEMIACANKYRALGGNIYGCEDPSWNFYGYDGHSGLVYAAAPNQTASEITVYKMADKDYYHVTEIGESAFAGNQYLTKFTACVDPTAGTFVNYLEKINANAFKDCTNLTEFKMVNGDEIYQTEFEICTSAFENCIKLQGFKLNPNTKLIGEKAFKGCTSLTSVDWQTGNTNIESSMIGTSAFEGCSNLETFTLHASTTSIGEKAFGGTKAGFILDATKIVDPTVCKLEGKIFGDTITEGTKIYVQSFVRNSFIKSWGNQLKEFYGLTDEEIQTLFVSIEPIIVEEQ